MYLTMPELHTREPGSGSVRWLPCGFAASMWPSGVPSLPSGSRPCRDSAWSGEQRRRISVERPIPRFLIDDFARHLDGRDLDDLVFTGVRSGNPLLVSAFRKAFRPAAESIGIPDLYPHELRHTAA